MSKAFFGRFPENIFDLILVESHGRLEWIFLDISLNYFFLIQEKLTECFLKKFLIESMQALLKNSL